METSSVVAVADTPSRRWIWLGVLLLVIGLLGHLFAARAIGGSYVAFIERFRIH